MARKDFKGAFPQCRQTVVDESAFPELTREQVDALLLAQNARVEVAARILEPQTAERQARERLANNGRNPANKNAGIRTGSDLHLCEMLISQLDGVRKALELRPFA